MRLRHAALRLHRWGGLATGAVISVVALTGAAFLLVVDIESRRTADRWEIEPAAGAERVSPSELLAAARSRHPQLSPLSVEIRRDDTRAAVVRFREGVAAYLDPWSGRVLGEHGEGATLSGWLVSLHTQLLAGEPGRLVVLIATVVLVVLVPLGLVLWWPGRRALARALRVDLRRGFRRANYDLHNVLGFYVSVLVLVLAGTGVLMATPSLRDLGRRAVAKVLPAPESAPRPLPAGAGAPAPEGVAALDAALEHGWRLFPDAPWVRAVLPAGSSSTLRVLAAETPAGDATRYHTVRVGGDGAVRRIDRYGNASPAQRFDRLVNQLHTASGLGPVYRWLAIVVCLIAGTLPSTGFLIWLDRRRGARRRSAAIREDPEPGISGYGG